MTYPSRATARHSAARPERASGVGARTWTTIVVLGLIGQLAWAVENMYLNVFVYEMISTDPTVIALLVASSAVAATLATMVIGALSDRVGKRKPFIVVGYIAWGLLTASFGLVGVDGGAAAATSQAVGAAIVAIVALDCIMSFFGSGANDGAFNAWVTESSAPENRGRIDSVLAIMPLIAMLIIFGAFDGMTRAGEWALFFGIIGMITALAGVAALFLMRESHAIAPAPGSYLSSVIAGLRPAHIRAHPRLYVTLLAVMILGISAQVYLPYLIIYIQRSLKIEAYAIVLGGVLIAASIISVLGGRVIDRIGKMRALLPATALLIVGLTAMTVARDMIFVMAAGTIMMAGMMLAGATASAAVRDATPSSRVGMVQGLRMIATVLIPMLIGPFIGAAVIIGANESYEELGVVRQVPTAWMFLVAAGIAVLVVVPALWLRALPVDAAFAHQIEQPEPMEPTA